MCVRVASKHASVRHLFVEARHCKQRYRVSQSLSEQADCFLTGQEAGPQTLIMDMAGGRASDPNHGHGRRPGLRP